MNLQIGQIHPALILLAGALVVGTLKKGVLRNLFLVVIPALGLWNVIKFGDGTQTLEFLGYNLEIVRADRLSKLFGYLFHIAAIIVGIYAMHVKDRQQLLTGFLYAGSAVGVVFAGDLITLFVFWELLAITSVFQIWARKSERSGDSGIRYLVFHISSGLLLLVGAAMQFAETQSLAFGKMTLESPAGLLIFLAFGIKCAFPGLHTWLTDSYPEATPTGTVFLCSFTTKAAVYAMARGFPGTPELIIIGAVMAMFPIFYAVIENDLRRVLGYSMINQIGFMMVGIGIGTPLAINGAVAHAFNDVLFKGLLFMSMGAVLLRTGRMNGSDLGGLYKSMPWTCGFCCVGAASISAFPLFSGFVSKSMVMAAAGYEGHLIVWLCLLFASAGVFHHAGIKIPFFAFFAHDSGIRTKEAPANMLVAMALAAICCIGIGCLPYQTLYRLLPHPVEYKVWTATHIITQTQLLFFSALAFAVLMLSKVYPPELRSVNLDADWFYRKSGRAFYWVCDKGLNGFNRLAHAASMSVIRGLGRLAEFAPIALMRPFSGKTSSQELGEILRRGALPIGVTACLAVLVLALLFFF